MSSDMQNKRIAFFLPSLHPGGAERAVVNLLKGMLESEFRLDLVLANGEGVLLTQVPQEVRVVNLKAGRVLKAILPLSRYLQKEKPYALCSHMDYANVAAVAAKKLAHIKTRLVLVEHTTLSACKFTTPRARIIPLLMKWFYPQADGIIGVSTGVARDLEIQLGFPQGKVHVIYNPVVDNTLLTKAKTPLEHPWFLDGSPPVFLAVGRLTPVKDFTTLITAFKHLREQIQARLIILGEGESRSELEAMIDLQGITEDVSLPGFVDNPYAYMSRAKSLVLSSVREGLPTVLIEAMACGCPVIATDCPSGPREILESDKYGLLVPVSSPMALAAAMLQSLQNPIKSDKLRQRSMDFSTERAVLEYLALLDQANG